MKCLILAGGSGDRLWPLSRKEYPKQFIEVCGNRSLLQEAVVRNLPYCEEFYIVTNIQYRFIVEGQMKAFQGLKYRCFYEEEARNTAAAISLIAMLSNSSEKLLVVASDTLIEGSGYKQAILDAMQLIRERRLILFGIPPLHADTGFGYICNNQAKVKAFCEKPNQVQAEEFIRNGCYWNSGMLLMYAGDFVQELRLHAKDLYEKTQLAARKIRCEATEVIFPREQMLTIPSVSVEKAVFEKSTNMSVVKMDVIWRDMNELSDFLPFVTRQDKQDIILEDCDNVSVVNRARKQLVLANGIHNLTLVNTEDALYVAPSEASSEAIRNAMQTYQEEYGHYFERNRIAYRQWGNYEVLSQENGFKVKRVTIYPDKTISAHIHSYRSEHWSIVSGEAVITLDGKKQIFHTNQSIYVPMGVLHEVSNLSDNELVIVEVGIGETTTEQDMIHPDIQSDDSRQLRAESITKLEPAFKDYIWGGTRLKEQYGKNCDYDIVAESWELSAHPAGQSVIAEGRFRGMLFGEYVNRAGKEILGWKCQPYEEFPLLIKFIDAREALSIQVHPDDDYALANEGEYGKNEMWYIMDCEPSAALYCGFNRDVTKEEVKKAIHEQRLLELLEKVEIHKNDTIFIPAGTVHAIGKGILICEIQQNSNSTYRMYDYGRTDRYGNTRELQLDKAMQVAVLNGGKTAVLHQEPVNSGKGYDRQLLGQCKYFDCSRLMIDKKAELEMDDASFCAVVVLDGCGTIGTEEKELSFKSGDTFFIPAGKRQITINGRSEIIISRV